MSSGVLRDPVQSPLSPVPVSPFEKGRGGPAPVVFTGPLLADAFPVLVDGFPITFT